MENRKKYLAKVMFWLPSRCKKDIYLALEADIDEHLAAEEDRVGHELTPQEEELALRAFGVPPVVATRYSMELPLISSGLMTVYRRVLFIALAGVILAQIVLIIPDFIDAEAGKHGRLIVETGRRATWGFLLAFTSVTLVFSALTRIYSQWGKIR
ncbi:hypothetical protein K3172_00365 [Qipengyuania sp. 6B39]|uniref:hypothetical protein n=1 Tax=Qipengyuania proteolytica TaxID=2867239 RepID=UPI001C8AB337|nr:hypothetical protein [Qipengyuania proteolytica]MBX7494303.1 hypothetical protein [Qipengyuania proteolytica]